MQNVDWDPGANGLGARLGGAQLAMGPGVYKVTAESERHVFIHNLLQTSIYVFMAALRNRACNYIFALSFLYSFLLSFFLA